MKNVKKNGIFLKLFWYNIFFHWKLKLLNFLIDSILKCEKLQLHAHYIMYTAVGQAIVVSPLHDFKKRNTNLHDFCWFHIKSCPAVSVNVTITQLWHPSHFTIFSPCHFPPPQIFQHLPSKVNFVEVKIFSLGTIYSTRGV